MLSILRSRTLRLAVLLFQAAWLNIVVPGHKRGIVKLPGETCPACQSQPTAEAEACCPDMAPAAPAHPEAPPSGDPASHCAICQFAVALFIPPAIDLTPPPLELVEEAEPLVVERPSAVCFRAPYHGRAPPASSFHFV